MHLHLLKVGKSVICFSSQVLISLFAGWTAPALCVQQTALVQHALSGQHTPTLSMVTAEPAGFTPLTLPVRTNLPFRRPSAPSRPLAATGPNSLNRPNSTIQPNAPVVPIPPVALTAPLPPTLLATSAPPFIPAQSTILAPTQPAPLARSTAPDRPTGPARTARRAVSDSHLAGAGTTGGRSKQPTGAGAPPPRQLSAPEIVELHHELSQLRDGADPFEIRFVGTCPGGRKTGVDVQAHLGLSNEAFQTIRVSLLVSIEDN